MILPTKNIDPNHCILGLGAVIVKKMNRQQTVTALWESVKHEENINSFEKFVLTLDLLFSLGVIDFSDSDILIKKNVD